MGVTKFCALLHEAKFGKNDKAWFPRWIRRYASSVKVSDGELLVTEAEIIRFSRSLLHNGTPAWQRLQAVGAIEAYRDLVLKSDEPSLREMRLTLGRLAEQERVFSNEDARVPAHMFNGVLRCGGPDSDACLCCGEYTPSSGTDSG